MSAFVFKTANQATNRLIKIGDLPMMRSIRIALLLTTPFLVIGSFASLAANLPISGYKDFMASVFGSNWAAFPVTIWNSTFGIISIIVVFTTSQQMVRDYNIKHPLRAIEPTIPALTAQAAFFCLIFKPGVAIADRWAFTGVGGLFVAILVAVLATKAFLYLAGRPFLRLKVGAAGSDMITGQVLNLLLPSLIVIISAVLLDKILFPGNKNVYDLIASLIRIPFENTGSELGKGVMYIAACQVAWFFGIHGSNLMDSVTHAIFEEATLDNLLAVESGLEPQFIITKQFFDAFVHLGGTGATIGLLLAVFMIGAGRGVRRIAQLSVLPSIVNVNELVVFGVPIILNPIYLIPFLVIPIILTITTYLAIYLGFSPNMVADPDLAPWTSPVILSGYLLTHSWHGPVLQLINIAISTVIYLPFVALADRVSLARFKATMDKIQAISTENEATTGKRYLHRSDHVGAMARSLMLDLEQALNDNREIYLEYQPQVRADTNLVVGVEALVRWRHPVYGLIPPPVIIGLAEDGNFIGRLGLKILNEACEQQRSWLNLGLEGVVMSVNIAVQQLYEPNFETSVLETIKAHRLPASALKIEVTESVALLPDSPSNRVLSNLDKHGLKLAIDDFGMGHSTLVYFKQFPVSTLKIDRALSKDIPHSETSASIISTIISLCKNIKADVIVEFVDNQKQLEALYDLGCRIFQGYLFSRPLSAADCLEYIRQAPHRPLLINKNLK